MTFIGFSVRVFATIMVLTAGFMVHDTMDFYRATGDLGAIAFVTGGLFAVWGFAVGLWFAAIPNDL